ncbi:MAG: hypothetical protein EXR50_07650, partial [Dehalococcoidia bacterium]|nr:hypothetical protein [Dehalococcoidia bacterium]
MPNERIQRQIDKLLDGAEDAAGQGEWSTVRNLVQRVLVLDQENEDAAALLAAAERGLAGSQNVASSPEPPAGPDFAPEPAPTQKPARVQPTSFVNGRYTVIRFLGEGGKKIVYLCKDTLLNREVAFALIKLEG